MANVEAALEELRTLQYQCQYNSDVDIRLQRIEGFLMEPEPAPEPTPEPDAEFVSGLSRADDDGYSSDPFTEEE